jgi:hypothetical protein
MRPRSSPRATSSSDARRIGASAWAFIASAQSTSFQRTIPATADELGRRVVMDAIDTVLIVAIAMLLVGGFYGALRLT